MKPTRPTGSTTNINDGAMAMAKVGFLIKEFDEGGYLERYPDIARVAAASNGLMSGKSHYQRHGKNESRRANYLTSYHPLFHLHVPKTAGSSLRLALLRSGKNVLSIGPKFTLADDEHLDVDVFSGHVGYRLISEDKNARLKTVTILRDPIDRLVSYYYHLVKLNKAGIEISERTQLAVKYDIEEFFSIKDHPHLISDMYNAMTWQILYGTDVADRMAFRRSSGALSETGLVDMAYKNLCSFLLVGFQDRMAEFLSELNFVCGINLPMKFENSNDLKPAITELNTKTVNKIEDWAQMDIDLYRRAQSRYVG